MTQRELENAVWRATMNILGYDPDSDDQSVQKRVRISWPLDEAGSPDWSRTEETVFIRLSALQDDYSSLWDILHEDDGETLTENVGNHQAFEVSWICYGVNALETAQKLRYGVLREDIRAYLNAQNIAFKSVLRMPVHMPEQDRTGDWWNRYDITGQLYYKQSRRYSEGFITTLPSIYTTYVTYPYLLLDVGRLDIDGLGEMITQTSDHPYFVLDKDKLDIDKLGEMVTQTN